MAELVSTTTSRRTMLGALALTAVAAAPSCVEGFGDCRGEKKLPVLQRTRAGRNLSRARYLNAERFFATLSDRVPMRKNDLLYQAGIVAQLGLSAHLLDVGFSDAWCAKHIGLHVSKSLRYANASGFGHSCYNTDRLANVLSPYGQWRNPAWDCAPPSDGEFTLELIVPLLRQLLDRVGEVTGHCRPRNERRAKLRSRHASAY